MQQHKGGSKQPNLKELIKQSKNAKKGCAGGPGHARQTETGLQGMRSSGWG